jgi:[ribosomal protein S18]-alanine N-acetyltransferase
VSVRRLGTGDEEVAERACRVFDTEGELDTAAFLRRPEATLIVAEDRGDVVGWVYGHELVHPHGELTMLLYALDVAEHAQRRGHGRALVEAFVDDAEQRGCTEVWVLTDDDNEGALATYRSAGGMREDELSVMFVWRLVEGESP